MYKRLLLISVLGVSLFLIGNIIQVSNVYADDYVRATEDPDNVKNKLYPKNKKFEFGGDVGAFLNQGFVSTILVHVTAGYAFSENWGGNLEFVYGMNSDKVERTCIESFYNKHPKSTVGAECASEDTNRSQFDNDGDKSNYGPAYMPIREINMLISANVVWNPIYGKQLLFLKHTSYFDVFVNAGAGVVSSTYYPESEKLANGSPSRCAAKENGGFDCGTDSEKYIGVSGRPTAESSILPIINLGVGQKFHFLKRFSVKLEFRNTTIIGSPSGFENLIAIWGGVGVRL